MTSARAAREAVTTDATRAAMSRIAAEAINSFSGGPGTADPEMFRCFALHAGGSFPVQLSMLAEEGWQSIARLQQASTAALATLLKIMVDPASPASTSVERQAMDSIPRQLRFSR